MTTQLRLEDLRRAWEAHDPSVVDLIEALAVQPDEPPKTPIPENALTLQKVLNEIQSWNFRKKPDEEQASLRQELFAKLEAADNEAPVPERLRLYHILLALWQDNGPLARTFLLRIIEKVRLTYGPWKALKRIFKEAEAKGDTEIYGALAARFDVAFASGDNCTISRGTLAYLVRRAWRYLRRLAVGLPASYADTVGEYLIHYPDNTRWSHTWIANHIFYHRSKRYSRSGFNQYGTFDFLEHRAYPELWQRTPRPLFALLERAKANRVWDFAATCLKSDFRAVLREVEPDWVARLVNVGGKTVDEFVVWILNNVPRFEQGEFRTLGLHEAVLKLFDSPSNDARKYAADYARTHARDLPVSELVRLANNSHETVRKLAFDLLRERDPRKDVGLDAWGELLETKHGHELAAQILAKSFGARELTPDWFKTRLFSTHDATFQFVRKTLPQVHAPDKLGAAFWVDVIDRLNDPNQRHLSRVAAFALAELARFDLDALDGDFLKRLILHPLTRNQTIAWINEGRLKASSLTVNFLKVLAFHPDWDADAWVANLKDSPTPWVKRLEFNEALADVVLDWLRDPRRFTPTDLTFDWLMRLVARTEPRYHNFAVDTMIRSFVPADFAPSVAAPAAATATAAVDLKGQAFLFTGKMATMKREDAEAKVKATNGKVAGSVTAKLHYLVIGDDGSPLYGHGKKGSKQVKAEELNAGGANIKIISETAFLSLLTSGAREVSEDATLAGCGRLWDMATAPGTTEAPIADFARQYIRMHHPDICKAKTDRPVDPGAEIPQTFLTYDRVEPLFSESRKPLREFALELAQWEFARWNPPPPALIRLCELPYPEVRQFIATALLAEDTPEHRRYRINPESLSPTAVYSFCESPEENTRLLGMELIDRSPRLQVPEELFRLTESPDRKVRAFVIRSLWSLYRDRGITEGWKPPVPPQPTVGAATRREAEKAVENRGVGAPAKPDHPPADRPTLAQFLRRVLFEVPPGRPPRGPDGDGQGIRVKVRPLPARRAKLELVEVMRDLGLAEAEFGRGVLPLLEEFMVSRGQSERAACLVAVTRIRHQHGMNGAGM